MKTCLSTDSRTLDWVQFGSVTNNAVANTFVCVSGFSIEYVHRIEPLSRYICMFTALAGIAKQFSKSIVSIDFAVISV